MHDAKKASGKYHKKLGEGDSAEPLSLHKTQSANKSSCAWHFKHTFKEVAACQSTHNSK